MKVAVWYNVPAGGAKRALRQQVGGLVAGGHTVHVWCPDTADTAFQPLSELVPETVHPLGPIFERHYRLTMREWAANRMGAFATMRNHLRRCAGEINSGSFDLVLAHGCRYFAAPALADLVEAPTVLYLQEPKRQLYEASPRPPWMTVAGGSALAQLRGARQRLSTLLSDEGRKLAIGYEVAAAAGFDTILVNSLFSREAVLRAYGLEARVCSLGIDTALFRPTDEPRQDHLVTVGALGEHKNGELLLRSVALSRHRPRLVWIATGGDPAYRHRLEATAADLDVTVDVRIGVTDTELVDELNRARAMIFAPRLEPFGFVPLEAAACGLAVVAVAEGGVRETVLHGVSGLLTGGGESALAAAVDRLMDRPDEAVALGQAGRRLVEQRWGLDAAAAALEAELVAARRGDDRRRRPATTPEARAASIMLSS